MLTRSDPVVRGALCILAVIAALWWLRAASSLLIPVVLAVCISYALEPLVARSTRFVPRWAAASILMVLIAVGGAWAVYSLRDDATRVLEQMPQATRRLRQLVTSSNGSGVVASLKQALTELRSVTQGEPEPAQSPQSGNGQERRGGSPPEAPRENASTPSTAASTETEGSAPPAPATGAVSSAVPTTALVQQGVSSGFSLLGNVLTVLFLVYFLLLAGNHFGERMIEATRSGEDRKVIAGVIRDANEQIQRFLLVRLATSAIVALATWAYLAWLDTPQALVWAMLAGAFNSIPYFGPVIVSGGLLVVGLAQNSDLTRAGQMAGGALAITSLEGWLLTPPLLGKTASMNATIIFLGLLLFTWLWGAWGALLAMPMLVVLKSVADRVPSLAMLSRLMDP